MTKRRTAERAVIDAALKLAEHVVQYNPGTPDEPYASTGDWLVDQWFEESKFAEAIHALRSLDLEPATAVRTSAMPMATSVDAAAYMSKRVHNVVGEVFGQILLVFRSGAYGLTTDQVEARLKRSHQSVSPRVTDLRDRGWIQPATQFGKVHTRLTRYGQQAIVWTPTQAALEAAAKIPEWSW